MGRPWAQYVAVAALASGFTASSAMSAPLILLGLCWLGLDILSVPTFDGMLIAASGAVALVATAARAGPTSDTAEAELQMIWEYTANAMLVVIGASQLFSLRLTHVLAITIATGGGGLLIGCGARHAPAIAVLRPLVASLAVASSCVALARTRESESRRHVGKANGASAEKTLPEVSIEAEKSTEAAAMPEDPLPTTQAASSRDSNHAPDTVEASLAHLERQVQAGSPHSMMLQAMSGGEGGTVAQQRLADFLHDIDDLVAKGTSNGSARRSVLTHRIGALRHIASSIEIADGWFERMRDSSCGLDLDFKFNVVGTMQAARAKSDTNSGQASEDNEEQTELEHFTYDVFLGGSCDPTTWRKDTAIPRMSAVGLRFYNPQVDVWTPELVTVEREAKEHAAVLFFVVDNHTRAVASLLEAAEFICRGRQVTLVINDIEVGSMIDSCEVGEREAADLNRGRSYLREVAQRHGVRCFDRVDEATDHVCKSYEAFSVVSKRESFLRKVLTPRSTMRQLRKLRHLENKRIERRRSAVERQSPRVSLKYFPKHASTGDVHKVDERGHVVNHRAAEHLAQNLASALNLEVRKS